MKTLLKNFNRLFAWAIAIVFFGMLSGCSNNKPNFSPQQEALDGKVYCTVSVAKDIEIASSTLVKSDDGDWLVEKGSALVVTVNLPQVESTTGDIFYFDAASNTIISGFAINNAVYSASEFGEAFIVAADSQINLIGSKVELAALVLCQKYVDGSNDTTYNKFNYKSNNFRNSLFSISGGKVMIDDKQGKLHYVVFDELSNAVAPRANISNNVSFDAHSKSIDLQLGIFDSASEISFVYVYADAKNNLFVSTVFKTTKFSQSSQNKTVFSEKIYGADFCNLNIEFAIYDVIFSQ